MRSSAPQSFAAAGHPARSHIAQLPAPRVVDVEERRQCRVACRREGRWSCGARLRAERHGVSEAASGRDGKSRGYTGPSASCPPVRPYRFGAASGRKKGPIARASPPTARPGDALLVARPRPSNLVRSWRARRGRVCARPAARATPFTASLRAVGRPAAPRTWGRPGTRAARGAAAPLAARLSPMRFRTRCRREAGTRSPAWPRAARARRLCPCAPGP